MSSLILLILPLSQGTTFYQRIPPDGRTLERECGCTLALRYARLKVRKYDCVGEEPASCAVGAGATPEETYGVDMSSSRVEIVGPSEVLSHPGTPPGIDMLDGVMDDTLNREGHLGDGSTLYVLDSGVFCGHQEFANARSCKGIMGYDGDPTGGVHSDGEECSLHGTQVASMAAGKNVGVAWDVHIVSLQVLTCQGDGVLEVLFKAIDMVKEHLEMENVTKAVLVASISLGGYSVLVNSEFDDMVQYMPVIFAAGNYGDEAARRSPASSLRGFSVGALSSSLATGENLQVADFSNFGKYVQLYAAGSYVTAAGKPPNEYATTRGTSFAAPIVAGIALALKGRDPSSSAWKVYDDLLRMASTEYLDEWGYDKITMLQRVARINYTAIDHYVGEYRPLTPLQQGHPRDASQPPSDEVKVTAFVLLGVWLAMAVLFCLCYSVSLSYPISWTKGTPITTSLPK